MSPKSTVNFLTSSALPSNRQAKVQPIYHTHGLGLVQLHTVRPKRQRESLTNPLQIHQTETQH